MSNFLFFLFISLNYWKRQTLTELPSKLRRLRTPWKPHCCFLLRVTEHGLVVRIRSFTTASTSARFSSCCTSTWCMSTSLIQNKTRSYDFQQRDDHKIQEQIRRSMTSMTRLSLCIHSVRGISKFMNEKMMSKLSKQNLLLESESNFLTSSSSFFRLSKLEWSLDAPCPSSPAFAPPALTSNIADFLSLYVPLYVRKSIWETPEEPINRCVWGSFSVWCKGSSLFHPPECERLLTRFQLQVTLQQVTQNEVCRPIFGPLPCPDAVTLDHQSHGY